MDWKLEFIFILIKFTVSLGDVLDNRGYEFIIAFMENHPHPKNMELFVATFSGDIVNVTVSTPKYYGKYSVHRQFQLSRGSAELVSINTKLQMFGSTLSPKGILIQATDEIIVYGVNRHADSVDAFLGLPTDVLGGEYYAVSFLPTEKRYHSKHYAQLLVVANFEDTQVQITFPESDDFSNVTFDGNEYDGGETLAITMNRCEALQLQLNGYSDMTGAYLQSDKPVAFFSGNARTVVGNGYTSDHLVEQLISTDRWGKQFVVVPVPGRDVGDYLKVVGYIGSTEIDIKCISNNPISTSVRIVLAKAGSYQLLEMEPRSYCYIVSNNSIFVVYIVKSRQKNDFHDPSMIMIPPMEQYAPEYVFTTIRLVSGMYKNYFLFVVEQENKDGLRLDGMPFPADIDYVSIPNTTLVAGYVMVGEGFHRFYHMSPISVFGGILYGQYSYESYGLPVGLRMAEINKPCKVTVTELGDGVDNDCDGLIDEELCTGANTGKDEDGDGKMDEDCAKALVDDDDWFEWNVWGECYKTRNRTCKVRTTGNSYCPGPNSESKSCVKTGLPQEVFEEMKTTLRVSRKTTSSYKRRLYSVPDHRRSSKAIGYVASGFLVSLFVVILFLDLNTYVHQFRKLFKGFNHSR